MQDSTTIVGNNLRRVDWVNIGLSYTFLFIPLSTLIYDFFGKQSIYAYAVRGIFIAFLVCALPIIYRSFTKKATIFLLLGFIFYVGSIILNNDTILIEQANQALLVWCLPFFFYGLSIVNYENLIKYLKIVSIPIIIVQCIKTLLMGRFDIAGSYDQSLGYENVMPFFVFWVSFLKTKKIINIVVPLLSFLLILMSGSRGPILCVVLGMALSIIIYNGFKIKNLFYFLILAAFFFFFYSSYYVEVFSWLLEHFGNLSVSTRSVEIFLTNSLDDDEGRYRLLGIAKDYVLSHPLYGTGLLNDRSYMYGIYRSDVTTIPFGAYCHNVFYEVMMQFGAYPGMALILLFLYAIYDKFKKSISVDERVFYCVILSVSFFPLFVSHSYLTFPHFYILLGLLFSNIRKQENI